MEKPREIFFCNMEILHKKKKHYLKEVVYKPIDGFYNSRFELNKIGIKEKVKVLNYEVIKSLGFENVSKEFTEVKRSDETRNKITGTYE